MCDLGRSALGWLGDSALTAEGQHCETYAMDVSSGNVFRNVVDIPAQEVVHRGIVLQGKMSEIAILQQSTRRNGFLREVIGVIPAVGVDVSQCESVVAKHAPIRIDAV